MYERESCEEHYDDSDPEFMEYIRTRYRAPRPHYNIEEYDIISNPFDEDIQF